MSGCAKVASLHVTDREKGYLLISINFIIYDYSF